MKEGRKGVDKMRTGGSERKVWKEKERGRRRGLRVGTKRGREEQKGKGHMCLSNNEGSGDPAGKEERREERYRGGSKEKRREEISEKQVQESREDSKR